MMSYTSIGLILLVCGYALFLIYDGYIQANRFGKTIVAVRLRRRVADAIFLAIILIAGLYYELNHDKNILNLICLILLLLLVLYHGFRFPKWRLKQTGFTAGGRFWYYESIKQIRLSEDGVLVLTLNNNYNVILPVAFIEDLDKAAAFFTGEVSLSHLTLKQRNENDL